MLTILEITLVRDNAQFMLDTIYQEHFPDKEPPKLSNGTIKAILQAAIKARVIEIPGEIDMGQVEANDLDWNDPGIIREKS